MSRNKVIVDDIADADRIPHDIRDSDRVDEEVIRLRLALHLPGAPS